jgi:putative flippase GtrA
MATVRTATPRLPNVLAQWFRFAVVGGSNTLLSWCAFAVLESLGVHYVLASALAFTLGAVNSYVLNRRWTFASDGHWVPELARFAVVQGVGLAIDVAALFALVHGAEVPHLLAQALVFPLASISTFALSRRWAFAGSARR